MSVVPLEMLGSARLSTAMGITSFVVGIFTTAQGPMHGKLFLVFSMLNTHRSVSYLH